MPRNERVVDFELIDLDVNDDRTIIKPVDWMLSFRNFCHGSVQRGDERLEQDVTLRLVFRRYW